MGWSFLFMLFSLWEMSMNFNHLRKLHQKPWKILSPAEKLASLFFALLPAESPLLFVTSAMIVVWSQSILSSSDWKLEVGNCGEPGFSMSNPIYCKVITKIALRWKNDQTYFETQFLAGGQKQSWWYWDKAGGYSEFSSFNYYCQRWLIRLP